MTQREEEKKRLYELIVQSYTAHRSKWEVELFEDYMRQQEIPKLVDDLLDGGVIVPPCKVGDVVYVISQFADDNVHTGVVERMCIDEEGNEIIIVGKDWFVDDIGVCKSPSDFGKTAFLTREAAERALKERDDNGT